MRKYSKFIPALYITSIFIGQGLSYGRFYLFHFLSLIFVLTLISRSDLLYKYIFNNKKYYLAVSILALFFPLNYLFHSMERNLHPFPILQYGLGFSILFFTPIACAEIGMRKLTKLLVILLGAHMTLSFLEAVQVLRWPLSPYSELNAFFQKGALQDYNSKTIRGSMFAPPTSFFWNPNNAAFVTLVCFPLIGMIRGAGQRLMYFLLSFFLILVSDSRSLLALFVFIALIYLLSLLKQKRHLIYLFLAATSCALLGHLAGADNWLLDKIETAFTVMAQYLLSLTYALKASLGNSQLNEMDIPGSIRERISFLYYGFGYLKRNFFFGSGIGFLGATNVIYEFKTTSMDSLHNFYLELLIEGGLIIFIQCCIFLAIVMRSIYTQPNNRGVYALSLVSGLAAIPVLSSGRYFLFLYMWIALIYFFSAGQNVSASKR